MIAVFGVLSAFLSIPLLVVAIIQAVRKKNWKPPLAGFGVALVVFAVCITLSPSPSPLPSGPSSQDDVQETRPSPVLDNTEQVVSEDKPSTSVPVDDEKPDEGIGEEDPVEIQPQEPQTEVSYEAELILMNIAEDLAKRIAQNPSTVKFSTFEWGFAREGRIYAVQGTFSCSNLMGVSEKHVLEVWCKASEDYSKIQPYKVVLDDVVIKEQ